MKAKFGAIIVDGRGKLGGKVFSKNRYGNYEKTKVTPINPQTSYQIAIRNNHKAIIAAWESLSTSDRLSWNIGTKQFNQKNLFGDHYYHSGYNLFIKFNINRLLLSEPIINICPSPVPSYFISSATVEARTIDNTVILTFSPSPPSGYVYKLYASPSLSAGINYSNRRFKLLGFISAADSSPMDISSFYLTRFADVGAEGQKIFFKLTSLNIATGIESQSYIFSTLILNSREMLKTTIIMSSADIIAHTPVTVVASPGVGKTIIPLAFTFNFIFNSIQYTGTGTISIRFTSAAAAFQVCLATVINGAVNVSGFKNISYVAQTNSVIDFFKNCGIEISSNSTIAVGNSTLEFTLFYNIV